MSEEMKARRREDTRRRYYDSLTEEKKSLFHERKDRLKERRRGIYSARVASLLQKAKARATAKGLDFNICADDLQIPLCCPVLGIPILWDKKVCNNPNLPSLDRIDNEKGYVAGNVYIISYRANALKKDANVKEMEAVIRYMEGSAT
jgi:hypothetical protein